ncbi:MAG: hypothetical protein A2W22_03735 [Candidatus Levybacteria bacterium RBG_16_35_11]|nr:MAG: hypothetical protein A2W22_03735 [Candidatus Levybacteria bacterium RBG_16_35_11]
MKLERLRKPISGCYRSDRAAAIKQVAEKIGMPFKILAEEGQAVPVPGFEKVTVSSGHTYIQFGTGKEESLGDFLKKVDKICPLPWVKPK